MKGRAREIEGVLYFPAGGDKWNKGYDTTASFLD